MRLEKIKEWLISAVDSFLIVGMVIVLGAFFIFFIFGFGVSDSTTENRNLASLPTLPRSFVELQPFVKKYTSYFDDHVPYRNSVTAFYNKSLIDIFNVSSNDKVLLGKDGWLYFKGNNKEAFDEYQGKEILSPDQMQILEEYLVTTNNKLKKQNKQFVVSIAPNKETIYPEYFPKGYARGGITKIDQVGSMLTENKIIFSDLRGSLLEAKQDRQIYYKTDTHWNLHGGYIQYSNIMKDLGLSARPIDYFKINNLPEQASGELVAKMLGRNDIKEDWETLGFTSATIIDPDPQIDNGFYSENQKAPYKKNVLIFGDSFSRILTPFMAESFQNVQFEWSYNINYDLIDNKPGVVVLEVAEGKISALVDAISKNIITAPIEAVSSVENNKINWQFDEYLISDDLIKLNGWAHINKQNSENASISLVLSSDAKNYIVPVITIKRHDVTKYFNGLNYDEAGFAVSIPKKDLFNGTYRLGIQIQKGDVTVMQYIDKIILID